MGAVGGRGVAQALYLQLCSCWQMRHEALVEKEKSEHALDVKRLEDILEEKQRAARTAALEFETANSGLQAAVLLREVRYLHS